MFATGLSSSDRSYCEGVACIAGSVFAITYRFLKNGWRDDLLVLHALMADIASIPYRVSDPGIAMQKLDWWRQELAARSAPDSQHPVVRALFQSGVLERLKPTMLNGYVSAVAGQATGDAIADTGALQALACRIGGAEALLEAGLDDSGPDNSGLDHDALVSIGAAAFLGRQLQNFGALSCGESWWLPLDLRARYAVTRSDLRPGGNNPGLNLAIEALCDLALGLLNDGRQTLRRAQHGKGRPRPARHLLISAAVYEKRLRRMRSKPARHAHQGVTVGEMFAAWRQAIQN